MGRRYRGGDRGIGSVFELSPPATTGGAWTETVLLVLGRAVSALIPLVSSRWIHRETFTVRPPTAETLDAPLMDAASSFELVATDDLRRILDGKKFFTIRSRERWRYSRTRSASSQRYFVRTTLRGGSFNGGTVFQLKRSPACGVNDTL